MDRIGHYHIEDRLGRGGMGEIFRAFDTKQRRSVAIKTIQSRMADDDQAYRRFVREMKLASRLHHPAIVEVFEVIHVSGGACVVMELVDGFTLREALRGGPLGLQDTLHIAQRVCEGLVEAHRHYIVHRDIKAENIMVSRANEVKILDFGLARAVGGDFKDQSKTLTRTGMIVGSAGSMAPEQILGEPVDPRTDLFALGCLVYRLLAGQSPFQSRSFVHTLAAITSTPHRPLVRAVPSIPEPVSRWVDQLLEKLPEHRPQSGEEALEALGELVASQGSFEFRASRLERPPQAEVAGFSAEEASRAEAEGSVEASVDVSMILGISPPGDFFGQPEFGGLEMEGTGEAIEEAFERCQERLGQEIQHLVLRAQRLKSLRSACWIGCGLAAAGGLGILLAGHGGLGFGLMFLGLALGLLARFAFAPSQKRLRRWTGVRQSRREYARQWLNVLRDVGGISDGWARARRERQLAKALSHRVERAVDDAGS